MKTEKQLIANNALIESLGQKPPFRYIDELISISPEDRCACFALHLNESQSNRFGDLSNLQSYLLIEAMAQASGILLRTLTVGEADGYLVGLENTRLPEEISSKYVFLDVLMMTVRPPIFNFFVQIKSDSDCIAKSEIQIISKRRLHG